MSGFETPTSGVGSDHSTNCVTIPFLYYFFLCLLCSTSMIVFLSVRCLCVFIVLCLIHLFFFLFLCSLNGPSPASFSFIFDYFQTNINSILQQMYLKNVNPIHNAHIQTRDLQDMSLLR